MSVVVADLASDADASKQSGGVDLVMLPISQCYCSIRRMHPRASAGVRDRVLHSASLAV